MSFPIVVRSVLQHTIICGFVCLFAACAPTADSTPTATRPIAPTPLATPIVQVTPAPLATALPSTPPTPVPPATATAMAHMSTGGRVVSFKTQDGITLGGALFGTGPRAVIFSNIGNGVQADWQELPALLAQQGYLVLTYDWRGFGASGGAQDYVASTQDLAAAIELIRAQGATRIILAGGSLGGIASIKNARIAELAGLVVISSPRNAPKLLIADEEIAAIKAPKLFVGSTQDTIIPYSETEAMYKLAIEPKTLQTFSGAAHGTDILKSADHDALARLLLDFIAASLPRPSQAQTEFTGSYVIAPDRFVSVFMDGSALSYRDFRTGRIGRLVATGEDTFGVGPGLGAQAPLESTMVFTRDTRGHVGGLSWQPGDAATQEPLLSGKRAEGFFKEQDARFQNGDIRLVGTLLVPSGAGPHPGLILINGSNPASRKDAYPRTRAEYLVYHGIAVLLYDKRGVGDSTGRYQEYASDGNIEDLAGDALAGIEYMKARPELDPHRLGMFGSSQAGWIAPRIAARSTDVAFMLLLSGPTVSPAQQNYYRGLLGQSLGDAEITRRVLEYKPNDFDPLPYLARTRIPALWNYGGMDENIPAYASITILDRLAASGQHNHSYRLYPNADHSLYDLKFSASGQRLPPRGTVPGMDDTILQWLLQQVKLTH